MRLVLLTTVFTMVAIISGCNSDESDNIAKAQECLNAVPQSDPGRADECLQFVNAYDSQQANILKCSIYLTSGGLMENKVIAAYNALKTTSFSSPNATFLTVMALDVPDNAGGLVKAQAAQEFCNKTGVSSIKTVASYILVGSTINNLLPDGTDPTTGPGQAALAAELNTCATAPATPGCEPAAIGAAAETIATNYCSTESADEAICADIESAIAGSNGSDEEIGEAVYCYLNGGTYAAGVCTP